mgnify:CR=1 FL=1
MRLGVGRKRRLTAWKNFSACTKNFHFAAFDNDI